MRSIYEHTPLETTFLKHHVCATSVLQRFRLIEELHKFPAFTGTASASCLKATCMQKKGHLQFRLSPPKLLKSGDSGHQWPNSLNRKSDASQTLCHTFTDERRRGPLGQRFCCLGP
eukprot:4833852-Amphidinium_carterae.1